MSFNLIIGLMLLLSFCIVLTSAYTYKSGRSTSKQKRLINRYTLLFNSTEELLAYSKTLYFSDLMFYVLYEKMAEHIEELIKLNAQDPSLKPRLETLRIKAEKSKLLVNSDEGGYSSEPGPFRVPNTEQKAIEALKTIKRLQRILEKARKNKKISDASADSELAVLDIYRTQVNLEFIFRKVEENISLDKFHTAEVLLGRGAALLSKKPPSDYSIYATKRIKKYTADIADAVEQLYLEQKTLEPQNPDDDLFEKKERWWKDT